MSNILIIVEHAAGAAKKGSLPGITFGQSYAKTTGGELHLLVLGSNVAGVAESLKQYDVKKIHVMDNACFEHALAESYTAAIVKAAELASASVIASAASSTSKDVLPRVSARMGGAMASDVLAIVDGKTFKRPMWAGNVTATVELTADVKVMTVRATEFDAPATGGNAEVAASDFSVDLGSLKAQFVGLKEIKSERPDITTANRVVAGGRGVKGAEGFAEYIEKFADVIGAGVGASRAVCDAGWAANDTQIGQTGKVVAPDLYFAIGISGAIQHVAGMKGSKTIVAINKDPEAPIFQIADYGLVEDLTKAVPALLEALK